MTSDRTGALSDGVFSIAATLLVLEIRPPDPHDPAFGRTLLALWPSFAAYVISFLTIGIVWVNHHALFGVVRTIDRTLLFLNLLLLMLVGFVPFPTALLADAFKDGAGERIAALVYGGAMTAMGLTFALIWTYLARMPGLLDLEPTAIRPRMARSWLGPALYAVATAAAVISPALALGAFALIALAFVHPGPGLPAS